MRGTDKRSGELFSYVGVEQRVRADHPLRAIRGVVNEALEVLSGEFAALYSGMGRPSIPPEMLLRAMLLQAFYSVRSERQLMERLEFDLLFRWFVGLGVDEPVWDHSMAGATPQPTSAARSAPMPPTPAPPIRMPCFIARGPAWKRSSASLATA